MVKYNHTVHMTQPPPRHVQLKCPVYTIKTEGVVLWYNGGVGQGLSETLQGSHAGQLVR
jgi:hypothetical protein